MLLSYITPADINVHLESTERDEVFAELLEPIALKCPEINRSEALNALYDRENKMSTAVFPKIAVPHAVSKSIKKTALSIGVSKSGIEFDNFNFPTYNLLKVNVIFEILFEENDSEGHLHVLRDILHLVSNPEFLEKVMEASNAREVYDVIAELES